MDYSKWKKILIVLMIINILWIFYNRVFGSTLTDYFINTTQIEKNSAEFTTGYYTIKVPSLIYDYDNILCATFSRSSTHIGILLFSNNKIFVDSNGVLYGEVNKPGYYWKTFSASTIQDFSNYQLSDFSYNGYSPTYTPSWAGYLSDNSNYSSTSLLGAIYDYSNQDSVIIEKNPFQNPQFDNSDTEIQSLDFDKIFINPRDYGIQNTLCFKVLQVTNVVTNSEDVSQNIYYYNDLTFSLNSKSSYIHEFFDSGTYYYSIPYSALKLKKDQTYYFILTDSSNQIEQTIGEIIENDHIFDVVLADTQNIVTTEDEILNSIINNNPSDNTNNIIDNNLPRPSYEDSNNNINIPGMNVNIPNDTTTFGFDYIFNTIYNSISSNPKPIEFKIPFVDYTFTINPNFLDEWLHNLDVEVVGGINNIVLNFIHAFYYFIISYYIINDIRKNIEKIKTGDIMTHTDTNIKADML